MTIHNIMQDETNTVMFAQFANIPNPPKIGDDIEGKVITLHKSRLFVDLSPFGTGVIYGKEFMIARDIIRKVRPGDLITAKVCGFDTADGYIELSLKKQNKHLSGKKLNKLFLIRQFLKLQYKTQTKVDL